jgi:hypothetical protein
VEGSGVAKQSEIGGKMYFKKGINTNRPFAPRCESGVVVWHCPCDLLCVDGVVVVRDERLVEGVLLLIACACACVCDCA